MLINIVQEYEGGSQSKSTQQNNNDEEIARRYLEYMAGGSR